VLNAPINTRNSISDMHLSTQSHALVLTTIRQNVGKHNTTHSQTGFSERNIQQKPMIRQRKDIFFSQLSKHLTRRWIGLNLWLLEPVGELDHRETCV